MKEELNATRATMTEMNFQPGSVEQALANGRRLLDVDPAAAVTQARTLLRSNPAYPPALRLLAAAFRRQRKTGEAERAEIEAIRASRHDPVLAGAARAIRENRPGDAEAALAPFVRAHPDDAAAHLMLGDLRGKGGAFREGEMLLRKAIEAAPAYLEAQIALAKLLSFQSRGAEALPIVEAVLARQPADLSSLRFKATLLGQIGEHEAAIAVYERLVDAHPTIVALWISYGDALRTVGRRDDSLRAYRKALEIDPTAGHTWWSITNLKAATLDDEDVAAMEAALASRPRDPDNSLHLHFALGAAHERMRRFGRSFRHYAEGNRIRRSMLSYDADAVTEEVRRSEQLPARFFSERAGFGHPSPAPIFVLGMPRSGSTLVEQILASHPMIEATAELTIIPTLIQTMMSDRGQPSDASYRDMLAPLSDRELREMGQTYLDRAQPHRKTDRPYFVDKLPHNWSAIGFIHLILPNARIIDVRRSPLDCCFSNFKLLFAQGHPSSYSLEEMAAYYRDYVRLLRHFDVALPGRVHRVIYERLVEEPETEIRRLLGHVGVPFDEACLRFHETGRSVATASSEQVRRPLNRDGLEAWRNYEPWLGPLKRALGDLPDDYAR